MKIPKLRFKEFSGEWEEKRLGEISSNIMYGLNSSATDFDGKNKYIRITDIDENSGLFKPNPLTSPSGELDDNFLVNKNDILFARTGASVGKTYHYNESDGKLYFAGFLIRFNINKADSKFVYYNTLRNEYLNWIKLTSMRTGQPGVNAEEYKSYKFNLPIFKEQEKIGNFLSGVDKKISITEEKLNLFKEYKKGVMQKIFTQKLRFKDSNGNNYPDWVEKNLGEVFDIRDGTHDSPKYLSTGYPLVTSKNVQNGKIDLKNVNYISLEDFEKINKRSKVSKGDILMGMIGSIGNLAIVDSENFAIKNVALIKEKEEVKNKFLYQTLQTELFYKKISLLNDGGIQKFISLNNIRNLTLKFPCLEEQEKIANFLSSIDNKIENLSNELENLKDFKKGLLQKMFI